MNFPNDPGRSTRRALGDTVAAKGWVFGGIILLAVIVAIVGFIWTGHGPSSTSAPPPSSAAGNGGSQSTGAGPPEAPPRR
jgi:hypothetical protein